MLVALVSFYSMGLVGPLCPELDLTVFNYCLEDSIVPSWASLLS